MNVPSIPKKKDSDLDDELQQNSLRNRTRSESKLTPPPLPKNNHHGGANNMMTIHPKVENNNNTHSFHLAHETYKLLYISLPSVAIQLSVRAVFPQTASTVGRVLGTRDLAAFSLASLTANLTCQSIIMGTLTAAETLMPRAFGQENYLLLAQLAIQGFIVSLSLLLPPMMFLCSGMEFLLQRLGQDSEISQLASEWIRVYLWAVPPFLLFRVVQTFLSAQHVVMPLVFGSFVACFLLHPLLLKMTVPSLGFLGSALCIVITQLITVLLVLLYLYIRPEHHPQTWPGLSLNLVRESVQPGPLWSFVKLSFGGVLSLSVSY